MSFNILTKRKEAGLVLLTLLVLSGLFLFLTPAGQKLLPGKSEEARLMNLLNSSGAQMKGAKITGWVKVNESAAGAGDPARLAAVAAEELGLQLAAGKQEDWQNAYARGSELSGVLPDGNQVSILGQVMEYPVDGQASHVMINLALNDYSKARKVRKQIKNALGRWGKDERVAITLNGWLPGELSNEEFTGLAEDLMAQVGGTVRERVVKENLVSLTGYSANFTNKLRYDDEETNINIALRRSLTEPGVRVYIASPVILTEY